MRSLLLKFRDFIHAGIQSLLDLCYPRDCYFCRKPAGDEGYICQECLERLSLHRNPSCIRCGIESNILDGQDFICSDCLRHPPAIERTFIVARYDNAIRDLIHTFKYRNGIWLTTDLGRYLLATYLERIQGAGITIDLIVPVPAQRSKRRRRGYNQTDFLASYLAKHLQIPLQKNILKRVSTGIDSQTRLHRKERQINAQRAYRLARHADLKDLNVLLIDDVVTTGATSSACAARLREAGAKAVYVLALARPLIH